MSVNAGVRILASILLMSLAAGCVQSTIRPIKEEIITSETSEGRSTVIDLKIRKYQELVRDYPKEPRYRERLARLCWMKKDHRSALKYLDQASRLDPGNPKYDYLRAKVYTGIGNYRLAEASYRKILSGEAGEFTGPYLELAELCMLQDREQEATAYLEKAIEIDPSFSLPHYYLGAIALSAGDEPAAIEHLEEYLHLGGGVFQDEVLQTLERLQPEIRIHHIRD